MLTSFIILALQGLGLVFYSSWWLLWALATQDLGNMGKKMLIDVDNIDDKEIGASPYNVYHDCKHINKMHARFNVHRWSGVLVVWKENWKGSWQGLISHKTKVLVPFLICNLIH